MLTQQVHQVALSHDMVLKILWQIVKYIKWLCQMTVLKLQYYGNLCGVWYGRNLVQNLVWIGQHINKVSEGPGMSWTWSNTRESVEAWTSNLSTRIYQLAINVKRFKEQASGSIELQERRDRAPIRLKWKCNFGFGYDCLHNTGGIAISG